MADLLDAVDLYSSTSSEETDSTPDEVPLPLVPPSIAITEADAGSNDGDGDSGDSGELVLEEMTVVVPAEPAPSVDPFGCGWVEVGPDPTLGPEAEGGEEEQGDEVGEDMRGEEQSPVEDSEESFYSDGADAEGGDGDPFTEDHQEETAAAAGGIVYSAVADLEEEVEEGPESGSEAGGESEAEGIVVAAEAEFASSAEEDSDEDGFMDTDGNTTARSPPPTAEQQRDAVVALARDTAQRARRESLQLTNEVAAKTSLLARSETSKRELENELEELRDYQAVREIEFEQELHSIRKLLAQKEFYCDSYLRALDNEKEHVRELQERYEIQRREMKDKTAGGDDSTHEKTTRDESGFDVVAELRNLTTQHQDSTAEQERAWRARLAAAQRDTESSNEECQTLRNELNRLRSEQQAVLQQHERDNADRIHDLEIELEATRIGATALAQEYGQFKDDTAVVSDGLDEFVKLRRSFEAERDSLKEELRVCRADKNKAIQESIEKTRAFNDQHTKDLEMIASLNEARMFPSPHQAPRMAVADNSLDRARVESNTKLLQRLETVMAENLALQEKVIVAEREQRTERAERESQGLILDQHKKDLAKYRELHLPKDDVALLKDALAQVTRERDELLEQNSFGELGALKSTVGGLTEHNASLEAQNEDLVAANLVLEETVVNKEEELTAALKDVDHLRDVLDSFHTGQDGRPVSVQLRGKAEVDTMYSTVPRAGDASRDSELGSSMSLRLALQGGRDDDTLSNMSPVSDFLPDFAEDETDMITSTLAATRTAPVVPTMLVSLEAIKERHGRQEQVARATHIARAHVNSPLGRPYSSGSDGSEDEVSLDSDEQQQQQQQEEEEEEEEELARHFWNDAAARRRGDFDPYDNLPAQEPRPAGLGMEWEESDGFHRGDGGDGGVPGDDGDMWAPPAHQQREWQQQEQEQWQQRQAVERQGHGARARAPASEAGVGWPSKEQFVFEGVIDVQQCPIEGLSGLCNLAIARDFIRVWHPTKPGFECDFDAMRRFGRRGDLVFFETIPELGSERCVFGAEDGRLITDRLRRVALFHCKPGELQAVDRL